MIIFSTKKCPICKTKLGLCSFGYYNCPECYKPIRKATKEEREKVKKYFERLAKSENRK